MLITVAKIKAGKKSTISSLSVDGKPFCYVLQDADRGLRQGMSMQEISAKKVKGATAIPEGKYQVIINQSARFKRLLPLVLDVPGFEGIRIHPGNTHLDTEGCLLPGERYQTAGGEFTVLDSRSAFSRLFALIQERQQAGEKIWLKIINTH